MINLKGDLAVRQLIRLPCMPLVRESILAGARTLSKVRLSVCMISWALFVNIKAYIRMVDIY